MTWNQQLRQNSIRAVTGTSGTYEEDWHALFTSDGIAAGFFNDRMLAWINSRLGTSYLFLSDAQRAFAIDQGASDWASMGTFVIDPWRDLYRTGLLAEYRFDEGSGTAVTDHANTNHINLDLPTTPNYTWTSRGVTLASGLVQTPSITGCRTRVILYRVPRNEGGNFIMSGGSSSGDGVLCNSVSTSNSYKVGYGSGIKNLKYYSINGNGCYALNRGGWAVLFEEFSASRNTAHGFGGRHTNTTFRASQIEIGAALVYSGQLSDADRLNIYNTMRRVAGSRRFYLDWRDCPVQVRTIMIAGQSNAAGSAPIAQLTAAQSAYTFSNVFIEASNNSPRPTPPPSLLQIGVNQTAYLPGAQFGPEVSSSILWESRYPTSKFYIYKMAIGSTYLAPSSTGISYTLSWHPNEREDTSSIFNTYFLQDYLDFESNLIYNGIGPNVAALWWMQGESEATSTTYSASYQSYLQSFYDSTVSFTGIAGLKIIVGRIRDVAPTADATAAAQVRAAQAAFVAANPTVATLLDTDSMSLLTTDYVHYDGPGATALGIAFLNATNI